MIMLLYVFSLVYYLHIYYRHYPYDYSREWQYGYKNALLVAKNLTDKYEKIVISDSIGRPYMYTLFYIKTDPKIFHTTKKDYFDAAGFYHVDGFDKYLFGGSLPETLENNTLYIWNSVPIGARVIDVITQLDGSPALTVFDNGEVK